MVRGESHVTRYLMRRLRIYRAPFRTTVLRRKNPNLDLDWTVEQGRLG